LDYLRRTLRIWIGVSAHEQLETPELPERLARLFLRVEEHERPQRGQWGCWEFGLSESFWDGSLWIPEVDRFVAEQRSQLAGRVQLEPLWPDARPFAVCLTHDVDFVSEQLTPAQTLRSARAGLAREAGASESPALAAIRPAGRIVRAAWGGIRRSPPTARALERCVDLEREYGVLSSYLFALFPERGFSRYDCVYRPNDRCRFGGRETTVGEVMRSLAADGFDVGLHGSFNSALTPGMLAREKAALEEALGQAVTTTRQHFLRWDIRTTPRLQAECGLTADSTLGFNRSVGFRAGTSLPFRHFDLVAAEELPLLEVPLVIHDGPLFRPDGLELGAELATEATLRIVREIEATGGLVTVLFHPNSLSSPGFVAVYRAILDYARERSAWVTSLGGVAEWWGRREERLAAGATAS
jgi:hypothetical protein